MHVRSYFFLVLILALPTSVRAVDGATPIWEPTTITQPGRYVVTRDVSAPAGSAIVIQSDDVFLDLNGFRVSGNGSPVVSASSVQNLTIRNGSLSNAGGTVVDIQSGNRVTLEDLRFTVTIGGESLLLSGRDFMIRRNFFQSNGVIRAVQVNGSNGVIESNVFGERAGGVFILGSGVSVVDNDFLSICEAPSFCIAVEILGSNCRVVSNRMSGAFWPAISVGVGGSLVDSNVISSAITGIEISGDRNVISRNVINSSSTFGLRFSAGATDNVFRGNVARGGGGGVCGGISTTDFCDDGSGNTSAGDNFMPALF